MRIKKHFDKLAYVSVSAPLICPECSISGLDPCKILPIISAIPAIRTAKARAKRKSNEEKTSKQNS